MLLQRMKRKHDALAGMLAETDMAENGEKKNDDDKHPGSKPAVKVEANRKCIVLLLLICAEKRKK